MENVCFPFVVFNQIYIDYPNTDLIEVKFTYKNKK